MAERQDGQHAGDMLLAWSEADRRLRPVPPADGRFDVADSWLVADGLVRGQSYHAERFTESCRRRHGVGEAATAPFLDAAFMSLPRAGRWFPRAEFEAGSGFRLRLRPAPVSGGEVVLRRASGPDRRTDPTVKGPDLGLLAELRRSAARGGADEVLLVSAAGMILEGALSAFLWWRGDVLCAPPPDFPVLPSVTKRIILLMAAEAGTEIRYEACRPEDLDGLELWTASALHGIRPVTAWWRERMTVAPASKAAAWQAGLNGRATPVATSHKREITAGLVPGGS